MRRAIRRPVQADRSRRARRRRCGPTRPISPTSRPGAQGTASRRCRRRRKWSAPIWPRRAKATRCRPCAAGSPPSRAPAASPGIRSTPSIRRSARRSAASAASTARPARRAAALTTTEVRKLCRACGTGLAGARDRALFLLGFAGALRRSELVGLNVEHVTWTEEGLKLLIERSKTDKQGEGAEIAIPRGQCRGNLPGRRAEGLARRWPRSRPVRCSARSTAAARSRAPG